VTHAPRCRRDGGKLVLGPRSSGAVATLSMRYAALAGRWLDRWMGDEAAEPYTIRRWALWRCSLVRSLVYAGSVCGATGLLLSNGLFGMSMMSSGCKIIV
jgi:hypothetical protein